MCYIGSDSVYDHLGKCDSTIYILRFKWCFNIDLLAYYITIVGHMVRCSVCTFNHFNATHSL